MHPLQWSSILLTVFGALAFAVSYFLFVTFNNGGDQQEIVEALECAGFGAACLVSARWLDQQLTKRKKERR